MVKQVLQFLKHDIWRIKMQNLPKSKRLWMKPLRIILMTLREFGNDKCALQASALTFYTLLSFVPVLALAFGIAKGFGVHETLETKVRELASGESVVQIDAPKESEAEEVEIEQDAESETAAEPVDEGDGVTQEDGEEPVDSLSEGQAQVVDQAISFATNMLENAKGGVVAGIGIIVLLWTVIKLLGNIEKSFNMIWHVRLGRGWIRKFSDYLSVMLVSPILFLISTSVTAFVASQFISVIEGNAWLAFLGGPVRLVLPGISIFLFGILFTFIYLFMPNTKVKITSAMWGGLTAGLFYQLTQFAFVRFQVGISAANAIYGTFAALPLFLTWLQLSWMIVLLGAEVSYSHQFSDVVELDEDPRPISPRLHRLVALCLVREVIKDFADGKPARSSDELAKRIELPMGITSDVLGDLVECGILSEVMYKGSVDGYQPAMDIRKLDLAEVILRLDENGREDMRPIRSSEKEEIEQHLESIREYIRSPKVNTPLSENVTQS